MKGREVVLFKCRHIICMKGMPHLKTNTNPEFAKQAQVPFWPCNALQNALSAPKTITRAKKILTFAFFLPLPNIVDMIASWLGQALGFALPIPAGWRTSMIVGRSGEKMRRLRDGLAFGNPSRGEF